ncbi:extracellular solute-binding protein [Ruminococcus sp.]|uniref:ABC transporter substrate-binding protein n=1 Tax=Ruminococcus sp. TaxID=41978 RepID=UPI001B46F486|nr:extracellular solute-binding protein [Ruminococcus sp.]MBP5431407.1 extracellular solute-binding protein [Ruminococcus sp.]
MKNIFSIILLIATFMLCIGCSNKNNSYKENNMPVMIKSSQLHFKPSYIEMANDFSEILCIDRKTTNYLIFGKIESGEYCGYITNNKFEEKSFLYFSVQETETVKSAALMKNNKVAILTTCDNDTIIYVYDSSYNLEDKYNIGEIISQEDYFTELLCCEEGFYINIGHHNLIFIDLMGNLKGKVETNGRSISGIINNSNGMPCVLLKDDKKFFLYTLVENKVTDEISHIELDGDVKSVCSGLGEYDITFVTTSGLYTLNNGNWLKITNFSDMDFQTHNIYDIDMASDTDYVVLLNIDGKDCVMEYLSKIDISDIKPKKIIKVALTSGGAIDPYTNQIKEYNSKSENYKVEFVDYYTNNQEELYNQLKVDIISGKSPDIVLFSDYMTVESFGSEESLFVDLYGLIDNDNEISRSDFIDGFLESLQTKGRLLQITPTFTVHTNMIKDKFVNGLKSWNIKEFEDVYHNMPKKMELSVSAQSYNKYEMFKELVGYEHFINKNKAECYFKSDEFIGTIETIKNNNIGISNKETSNGIRIIDESTMINSFRNDEVLVQNLDIWGYHYLKIYQQVYSGEKCTFIGFPSENKIRAVCKPAQTFGIMKNSDNIDGAWDFLKYYMFSEESLTDPHFIGFSGLKNILKQQLLTECIGESSATNDTVIENNSNTFIYFSNSTKPIEVKLRPFTEEEATENEKLVIEALKHPVYYDNYIETILFEELNSYFEEECTVEEASAHIQNRVSIYLSEQS